MKALVCTEFGAVENLKIKNINLKTLEDDEVSIDVKACGINFPDVLMVQNKYQIKPELPFSPGGEFSGVIVDKGKKVKNLNIGDRVFALSSWGGLAEKANVKVDRVFKLPMEMDFLAGASLMYNYGTALYALKNKANLKNEETILILGAAGGVGLAAVELAKIYGATVIAAASNWQKLEICKSKGADFIINYKEENLRERIDEITKHNGIDVVFDPIGDFYSEQALRALKWKGRYLVVGFASGEIPKLPLNLILLKGISVIGVFWGRFSREEMEENQKNFNFISHLYATGKISPTIFKYYILENAVDALKDLEDRKVIGKALVIIDPAIKNEQIVRVKQEKPEKVGIKTVFQNQKQIIDFVNKDFHPSNFFEITQKLIDEFAEITQDKQWIHIDSQKAKNSKFGTTIAHGLLIVSIMPKLLNEVYEIQNCKMGINYGLDNIRFLKPIKSGSTIQLHSKLIEAINRPNNSIKMTIRASIKIKGEDEESCVANCISLAYF